MSSDENSIQVAIRIRPINKRENSTHIITRTDSNYLYIQSPDEKDNKFAFDYIYDIDTVQETVYKDIGNKVVENAFASYNNCVFAYGQTGCFARGTTIKMFNNNIKPVENIITGDEIMGDDNTKRTVMKLFRGQQQLYKVSDIRKILPDYIVNYDHIMVLYDNKSNTLYESPIHNMNIYSEYFGMYYDNEFNCPIRYPIRIEMQGVGDYYGFMLDGNHRFQHSSGIILRNSGKSHTMMGSEEDPGLIPRICKELFCHKCEDARIQYKFEISYLEIYSEQVRDLLGGKTDLNIRQHPQFGPYVEGLTQILVNDYSQINNIISQGNKQRIVASTLMNANSSRSHAILTIYLTKIIFDEYTQTNREIMSKVNLVDLAGSEKVNSSGVTGINFKEAVNINKSLSALGLVINKLSSQKGDKLDHIPFRDSVLTWILKESLGGNSKTFMVATISPSEMNYNESLNTLRYASHAKKIMTRAKINEDPNDHLINTLRNEIEELQKKLLNQNNNPSTDHLNIISSLEEEIRQRELLMKEKEKSWEQKFIESNRISKEIQDEYSKKITEYKISVENQTALHIANEKNLSTEVSSLKLANTDLSTEVSSLKQANTDLSTEVSSLKQANTDLSTEVSSLKQANADLSTEVSSLKRMNSDLSVDISHIKSLNENLATENLNLKIDNTKFNSTILHLSEENKIIKNNCEQANINNKEKIEFMYKLLDQNKNNNFISSAPSDEVEKLKKEIISLKLTINKLSSAKITR